MAQRGEIGPRLGYSSVSLGFLALAAIALLLADIAVTSLDPWAELSRLAGGMLGPDILSIEVWSVVYTVAFAVLGVGLGASTGFLMALVFHRLRLVRIVAAFVRSVHELFWALLLLQVTGLSATTGILAIAIPYAGIFAKVFSEMIEEADLSAERLLPEGTSTVSAFAYVRLPELARDFGNYTLYRLECGLRSTLVLGFVGLPTIGFHLESYFKQGHYAEATALLLVFFALIGTRRLWARLWTIPILVTASLVVLPETVGGGSALLNTLRFVTHDIVPAPLRGSDLSLAATWTSLWAWVRPILAFQVLPGALQTLVLSQIALAATGIAALALFPLVCRVFMGRVGQVAGRILLVVARSTPEYMLAYVLLQLLGPSMLPAIIALSFHNAAVVAYLLGRHADALPYRADASRGLNLFAYETVPRLYGQFMAYLLYRWEIILRESAIFGMLGVTTLGFFVDAAFSELRLDRAVVLILAVAILSMAVDTLSRRLRRALRIQGLPTRLSKNDAAWRTADGGAGCR